MNPYVKGQIITEIKNPENTPKRFARMGDEEMTLTSPTGRVMIEIFNDWDNGYGHWLKIGGEEIAVGDKDFDEIATALRVRCDGSNKVSKQLSAQDKKTLALLAGKKNQK